MLNSLASHLNEGLLHNLFFFTRGLLHQQWPACSSFSSPSSAPALSHSLWLCQNYLPASVFVFTFSFTAAAKTSYKSLPTLSPYMPTDTISHVMHLKEKLALSHGTKSASFDHMQSCQNQCWWTQYHYPFSHAQWSWADNFVSFKELYDKLTVTISRERNLTSQLCSPFEKLVQRINSLPSSGISWGPS